MIGNAPRFIDSSLLRMILADESSMVFLTLWGRRLEIWRLGKIERRGRYGYVIGDEV